MSMYRSCFPVMCHLSTALRPRVISPPRPSWHPADEPTTEPRVEAIAHAPRELVNKQQARLNLPRAKEEDLNKPTFTDPYNHYSTWLRPPHHPLHKPALDAYARSHGLDNDHILTRLLHLNLQLA